MKLSALVGLLAFPLVSTAAQTPAPTPAPKASLFTKKDAIWVAVFTAGSVALTRADVNIARRWADSSVHAGTFGKALADNFAKIQEGTLTVGNLALWGVARLAHADAMADITFHAAESVVAASLTAQIIRGPLGRSRPYETNYNDAYDFHPFKGFTNFKYRAFPSIHTASAFAVATVYTLETHRRAPRATWIVGPIAYAVAMGPGIARMYQGQHWASDVLAGAFLGTFAGAKIVRYNHDVKPDNFMNRLFLGDRGVQLGFSSGTAQISYSRTF